MKTTKKERKTLRKTQIKGKTPYNLYNSYHLKPVALPQNSPDHAVYKDQFLLEGACSRLVLHCIISTGCNCFISGSTVSMFVPPATPPTPTRAGFSVYSGSSSCPALTHHWGFWTHIQKVPEIRLAEQRAPAVATLRETSLSDPRSRNTKQETAPLPGWDAVYIFF